MGTSPLDSALACAATSGPIESSALDTCDNPTPPHSSERPQVPHASWRCDTPQHCQLSMLRQHAQAPDNLCHSPQASLDVLLQIHRVSAPWRCRVEPASMAVLIPQLPEEARKHTLTPPSSSCRRGTTGLNRNLSSGPDFGRPCGGQSPHAAEGSSLHGCSSIQQCALRLADVGLLLALLCSTCSTGCMLPICRQHALACMLLTCGCLSSMPFLHSLSRPAGSANHPCQPEQKRACPHQVARQQHFGAVLGEILEGGDGRTNACVVRDLQVLVQRHIQIGPDLQNVHAKWQHVKWAPALDAFFLILDASSSGRGVLNTLFWDSTDVWLL